ncbi:MAG: hypothetical protein AAF799_45755 [Myxococcota bacterium]
MTVAVGLGACTQEPLPEPSAGAGTDAATSEGPSAGDSTGSDDSTGNDGVEASVTYHEHLRPLLDEHCVSCHTPGNIGPFPLTNYDEVFTLREAIVNSVNAGTMPPWLATDDCQPYVGARSLAAEEIELVQTWLAEGAHEGNPDDYVPVEVPPPPSLSRVDIELTMPQAYTPQAEPDDYRCFLLEWPETEPTFVTGFEAAPDDLAQVHHIIAFAIPPEEVEFYEQLDAEEPGEGYTCFGGPGGEVNDPSNVGTWIGSWAPGGAANEFPEGTGLPMAPGSRVVLQVHYNTLAGDGGPDRSGIRFKVDSEVERPAAVMLWANPEWLAGFMPIPAGSPDTTHAFQLDPTEFMGFITDGVVPSDQPFEIHSASHHMHTRGSRAHQSIVRGSGSDTCLLELPRWDFDWQTRYRFEEPIVFLPGDELRMECEWNNEGNDQGVNWGDGTGDEMCLGIFYVTPMQ